MLKKKISVAFVATILSVGVYSYTESQKQVSMDELGIENIEALARGESGGKCTGPKNTECKCELTTPCSDLSGCSS